MHNHTTHVHSLRYCSHCDMAYCPECGREWCARTSIVTTNWPYTWTVTSSTTGPVYGTAQTITDLDCSHD